MASSIQLAHTCCTLDSVDNNDTEDLRCQFDDAEVAATYNDGFVACHWPDWEGRGGDPERQGLRLRVVTGTGRVLYESLESAEIKRPPIVQDDSGPPSDREGGPDAGVADPPVALSAILGGLSWLDKLLPLWIILAITLGILLSVYVPGVHTAFSGAEWEGVSIPLAVGLIVMMIPPLCKVQWEALPRLLQMRQTWHDIGLSLVLNWVVGPLLMLGLAWASLPDLPSYRTGVIMVGLARCIAMVLIWNQIARGDPELCAFLVIINSLLQIVLYAPLALLYCQVIPSTQGGFDINYAIVARSVGIYLGIPLAAGASIRAAALLTLGKQKYEAKILPWIGPWALIGLLYTIVVIFGQQGDRLVHNPGPIFRTFVPLVLYFGIMWAGTIALSRYLARYRHGLQSGASSAATHPLPNYKATMTQAFTAASNNFELSIAVAAAVFGADSDQALAATVGPLLEVPILLALSYAALWLRGRLAWEDVKSKRETGVEPPPEHPSATMASDDGNTGARTVRSL